MDLTNDSYVIVIHTKSAKERYFRDRKGWLKVSTRGRRFRATAEQVLNHLLPALAGLKRGLRVEVRHRGAARKPKAPPGRLRSGGRSRKALRRR